MLNMDFEPSWNELEEICQFFELGTLRKPQKKRKPCFPHANPMVFVETSRGQFVFKFFRENDLTNIAFEYAVNRALCARQFPTPAMSKGRRGRPFVKSAGRLAACYAFVDGFSAWKVLRHPQTVRRINLSLRSLKDHLSATRISMSWPRQAGLAETVRQLTRWSRAAARFEGSGILEQSLLEACRVYQRHRRLFGRQRIHSDANLSNFLMHDDTAYVLDLEHIREDYALNDLSSMVVSGILSMPVPALKAMIKDYFDVHDLAAENRVVLDALVKISLVKECLGSCEQHRKESLAAILKNLSAAPGLGT